jgi:hypothetical protein
MVREVEVVLLIIRTMDELRGYCPHWMELIATMQSAREQVMRQSETEYGAALLADIRQRLKSNSEVERLGLCRQ